MRRASQPVEDIYGYLAAVKARPEMYIGDPGSADALKSLETLICGYEAALIAHDIQETPNGRTFTREAFGRWLWETRGWSTAPGITYEISQQCTPKDAFRLFFELIDEFRNS